jgi:hypothetical protein
VDRVNYSSEIIHRKRWRWRWRCYPTGIED